MRSKLWFHFLIVVLICVLVPIAFAQRPNRDGDVHDEKNKHLWQEREIIIKFREASDPHISDTTTGNKLAIGGLPPSLQQIHKTNAIAKAWPLVHPSKKSTALPIYVFRFSNNLDIEVACKILSKEKGIEYAEPNYVLHQFLVPNDPYYSSSGSWGQQWDDQWGLKLARLSNAWDLVTATNEVIVAVIDSGLDLTHPEIIANIWTNHAEISGNGIDDDENGYADDMAGWNFITGSNDPTDDNGHGTMCAGIVAAGLNNGLGMAGIGLHNKVMPLKALAADGTGSTAAGASAIYYAANNGARVINMSFGGTGSSTLQSAVDYAHDHGVVLVAAAGNSSSVNLPYPAGYRNVITVGASDHFDQLADFSNFGARIDLVAPGGDSGGADIGDSIISLRATNTATGYPVGDAYVRARGTSFSAPFVSGVVGLMLTQRPALQNEEVRQILRTTANDIMSSGWDVQTGYGRVNAYAALQQNSALIALLTTPTNGSFLSSTITIQGSSYGSSFSYGVVEYGQGQTPGSWNVIGYVYSATTNNILAYWNSTNVPNGTYTIRLRSMNGSGKSFEDRAVVSISNFNPPAHQGWPEIMGTVAPIAMDLNNDGLIEIISGNNIRKINGTNFPGWPQIVSAYPVGPSSAADLNGDGNVKIGLILNQWDERTGQLLLWNRDGTFVPGWPKSFISGNPFVAAELSPVFADINNDGRKEIIWCSSTSTNEYTGTTVIHVDRADGTSLPGWPVTLPPYAGNAFSSPSVGDIDGDGLLDIAIGTVNGYVFLLHQDGTLFQNWPVVLGAGNANTAVTAFADVDHDGQLELFAGMSDGSVALYRATAQLVSGWPKKLAQSPHPPAFGDLDETGKLAIAFGSDGGLLYVFNSGGTPRVGWPQTSSSRIYSPGIADLNHDGHLDLMSADGNGYVYAWDAGGRALGELGFPLRLGDTVSGYSAPVVGDFDGDGLLEFSLLGYYRDNTNSGNNLFKIYTYDLPSAASPTLMPYPTLMGDNSHQSRYNVLPVISSISPNYLTTNPISQLTITGDYFLKGMKVFLGTNQLPVISETVTSIVASASNIMPGWYTLKVYNVNSGSTIATNTIDVLSSLDGDDDGDGLPNGWEIAHGFDPHDNGSVNPENGAQGDPDHDGMQNWQEYIAGTDPRDPKSVLKILKAERIISGRIQLSWQSVAGKQYTIFKSTNLQNGFSVLTNELFATPPTNSFSENITSNAGPAFYRIGVP